MRRSDCRENSGFAVATVLAMGVVASLWMLATASFVLPSLGRIGKERASDMMRSSAEAGLDWAVQQLNNPQTRSGLDGQTVSIPSTVLASNNFTGTVTVTNQSAPNSSYLYDPLCDPNNQVAAIQGGNGWRIVTATVTTGLWTKRVRVILKPVYTTSSSTTTTTTTGPATPIFSTPLFGRGAVSASMNLVTNSYNSSTTLHPLTFNNTGANVATTTSLALSNNASIGGDVDVYSAPSSSTAVVSANSSNVNVNGSINANGTVSGITQAQVGGAINEMQSAQAPSLPQTPQAPSTANNLGTVNIQGNTILKLTGGDYIMSSLVVGQNAQIQVSGGPVNVYVQGVGSTNGINIGGNGISNGGAPANLRIWYNGTGPVQIASNATFTGLIYAPNANISVGGNGAVYGALVGNNLTLNGNGAFHYDTALGSNASLMWSPPVTTTSSSSGTNLDHYQVVSWAEL